MAIGGVDPTRLYSALLNTGLQNKDNALYQVIYQLIGQIAKLTSDITGVISGGGAGTTILQTNIIQQLELDGGGSGGGEGDMGPPGAAGSDGANGMVPYFISSVEIFVVPEFKQALFSMNIDNEGTLEVNGFLIEVD